MNQKPRTVWIGIVTLLILGSCGGEPTEEDAELARHPSKEACLGYAKVARALTSPATSNEEAQKMLQPYVDAIDDYDEDALTEAHDKIEALNIFLATRTRKQVYRFVPEVEGACLRAAEKEGWEHDEY